MKKYFCMILSLLLLLTACSRDYVSDIYDVEVDNQPYIAEYENEIDIKSIVELHNSQGGTQWSYIPESGEYSQTCGYISSIVMSGEQGKNLVIFIERYNTIEETQKRFQNQIFCNFLFEFSVVRFGNYCISGTNIGFKEFLRECGYTIPECKYVKAQVSNLYKEEVDIDVASKQDVLKNKGYIVYCEKGSSEVDNGFYFIYDPTNADVWIVKHSVSENMISGAFEANKAFESEASRTIIVTKNNTIWYCRSEESFNKLIADLNE